MKKNLENVTELVSRKRHRKTLPHIQEIRHWTYCKCMILKKFVSALLYVFSNCCHFTNMPLVCKISFTFISLPSTCTYHLCNSLNDFNSIYVLLKLIM